MVEQLIDRLSANVEFDAPPILENQAVLAQEQPFNDHDPMPGSSTMRIKTSPITDAFDDTHNVVGEVVEGADGEFYLIADDDDGEEGSTHQGVVDINNVREVKIMLDNDQSHMVYFDRKNDNVPGPGHLTESAGPPPLPPPRKEPDFSSRGLKSRRNRVYGSCRCQECGQTFVNTARLERHLAVHQMFGNFSCPLCGKTYKYEYNLFYHWRKTCRDLDDVFSIAERKDLDVNTLRSAVEDLVRKKDDFGPMEMSISTAPFYNPFSSFERRLTPCRACGVAIHSTHMPRHLDLHRGIGDVDQHDHGSYYCDLCGLMFRQHFNLIKHWRVSCPEILANMDPRAPISDVTAMKGLVREVLRSVVVDHIPEHPTMREITLREKARLYESAAADLNFPETTIEPSRSTYTPNHPDAVVYTDDIVDDNSIMASSAEDGIPSQNRAKWVNNGLPVQCHECKRAFANVGRLERHMAGYHSSTGSHHCPLCGNRFKYDYNLLYHYRRSCPYTKSFIEGDVRQQLDAATLRKLVRSLATKDLRVTNETTPSASESKDDNNDSAARRDALSRPEMMRNLPQMPPNRPGMPDGKTCPICGIMFYGLKVLDRHVQAAHRHDHPFFDPETGNMRLEIDDEKINESMRSETMDRRHSSSIEAPPVLDEPELEHESAPYLQEETTDPGELEKHFQENPGPLQIIDDQGNVISEVRDFQEVQHLVETGQLGLRPSDRFVVVHSDGRGEIIPHNFICQDGMARDFEGEGEQIVYYEEAPLDADGNLQAPPNIEHLKYETVYEEQHINYEHYGEIPSEMDAEGNQHSQEEYVETRDQNLDDGKHFSNEMVDQQQELMTEQPPELEYVADGDGQLQYVEDVQMMQMNNGNDVIHELVEQQQYGPVRHSPRKRLSRFNNDEYEYVMPMKRRRTPRSSTSEVGGNESETSGNKFVPKSSHDNSMVRAAMNLTPSRRSVRQHAK